MTQQLPVCRKILMGRAGSAAIRLFICPSYKMADAHGYGASAQDWLVFQEQRSQEAIQPKPTPLCRTH
jgi:hypothetical protein